MAGKDSNGKTIYLEPDRVTAHRHKFKERTSADSAHVQPTTLATSTDTIISKLDKINAKLDRLLAIEGQE
ncbi:MAG: hypothetical protein ACRD8W_24515 [Nitrososphaeraceae archaeon]